LRCDLGTIPAGGSVTITLVTTPSAVGTQTNTVTVVGNESECDRGLPPAGDQLSLRLAGVRETASHPCHAPLFGRFEPI